MKAMRMMLTHGHRKGGGTSKGKSWALHRTPPPLSLPYIPLLAFPTLFNPLPVLFTNVPTSPLSISLPAPLTTPPTATPPPHGVTTYITCTEYLPVPNRRTPTMLQLQSTVLQWNTRLQLQNTMSRLQNATRSRVLLMSLQNSILRYCWYRMIVQELGH